MLVVSFVKVTKKIGDKLVNMTMKMQKSTVYFR